LFGELNFDAPDVCLFARSERGMGVSPAKKGVAGKCESSP